MESGPIHPLWYLIPAAAKAVAVVIGGLFFLAAARYVKKMISRRVGQVERRPE